MITILTPIRSSDLSAFGVDVRRALGLAARRTAAIG